MKKVLLSSLGLFLSLGVTQHAFPAAAVEDMNNQDKQWLGKQLIKAVESNDLLKVQKLINQGAPINFKSAEERTLDMTSLMVASKLGFTNIVVLLLESRANPNIKSNNFHQTALMLNLEDAPTPHDSTIVKKLLNAKAHVNEYDDFKRTPLMYASYANNSHQPLSPEIIYLLINAKANLNAQNEDGNTTLMEVVKKNKYNATARTLIFAGARLDMLNNDGNTVWNIPLDNFMLTHKEINSLLEQAIDEKTTQLSIQLHQHALLTYKAIDIVIDYLKNDYSCPEEDNSATAQS